MSERVIYRYLVFIVLSAFFLGNHFLENIGVQYVSDGGSPIVKIHIYAYLIIILFVYLCLRYGPIRIMESTGEYRYCWLLSIISISIVSTYGLFRFGTSGLAYLVNTILAPVLLFPLVCRIDSDYKVRLLKLLSWLIFINSIVALVEFVAQQSLISVDIGNFSFYRSTAFLSHPLNNALITASLASILIRYSQVPRAIYSSVVLLALFAFGGRAAMAIFLGTYILTSLNELKVFLTVGVRVNRYKAAAFPFILMATAVAVMLAVGFTPIGERILSKLFIDTSASARFDVFILLDQLSYHEWFLGARSSLLNNIEYFIGINVVENYMVGWILSFGLICCFLLTMAVYNVPLYIARNNGFLYIVVLASFILISLSNNALSSKTNALLFLFFSFGCVFENDPI